MQHQSSVKLVLSCPHHCCISISLPQSQWWGQLPLNPSMLAASDWMDCTKPTKQCCDLPWELSLWNGILDQAVCLQRLGQQSLQECTHTLTHTDTQRKHHTRQNVDNPVINHTWFSVNLFSQGSDAINVPFNCYCQEFTWIAHEYQISLIWQLYFFFFTNHDRSPVHLWMWYSLAGQNCFKRL